MSSAYSATTLVGELVIHRSHLALRPLLDANATPLKVDKAACEFALGSIVVATESSGIAQPYELLARPATALAAMYIIAGQHGLNPLFPPKVEHELQALIANPQIDADDLLDLTHCAFATVDGAHTRDLDQALYIESTARGFRVLYALADAASYVKPGDALFDEALMRGASFYLPGLVVPMLPRELSEGLVSLNPNVNRRALVFELDLDAAGQCTGTRLHRARIRSRAKLSFDTVQAFLDNPSANPIEPDALAQSLLGLKAVGELRLQDRHSRDVVRYRRSDVQATIGDDPMRVVVIDDLRNDVERYNEELSLLCNVQGAEFLHQGERDDEHVQAIYRVHPKPEPERVARFERIVEQLIEVHQLDRKQWMYRSDASVTLAQYLHQLPVDGVQGRIAQAIHRQAIMMNARSAFSQRAGGHYGVGAELYARFSAPMREIVGVFLHKEVIEKLGGADRLTHREADEALRNQVVERANEARRIQALVTGAANRLAIDQLFAQSVASDGDSLFAATVMGLASDRVYLKLDRPAIEVKAYLRDLAQGFGQALTIDDAAVAVVAKHTGSIVCRLGDAVQFRVRGRDERRDRWVLHLNGKHSQDS